MNATLIPVPASAGPYTVLTRVVPTAWASELAEQLETLIAEHDPNVPTTPATDFVPPHNRNYGPKDAWELEEWTAEDLDALRWVLADLSAAQRSIITQLVEAEGEYLSTTELLTTAGYPEDTRASGVFRSIAGRCRANGRKPLWDGMTGSGEGRLLAIVRPGVRELLQEVMTDGA